MILQKIRASSDQLHRDLENTAILRPLSKEHVTMLQYVEILQKFYAFFNGLEQRISKQNISEYLPDFNQRRKSSLLVDDLRALGYDVNIKSTPQIPLIRNTAYSFGCLYVLEGSTLGGKFIYQHVSNALQLSGQAGASFFFGYGTGTGSMWKNFLEKLAQYYEAHPLEEQDMIAGTVDTFAYFKDWLNLIE